MANEFGVRIGPNLILCKVRLAGIPEISVGPFYGKGCVRVGTGVEAIFGQFVFKLQRELARFEFSTSE